MVCKKLQIRHRGSDSHRRLSLTRQVRTSQDTPQSPFSTGFWHFLDFGGYDGHIDRTRQYGDRTGTTRIATSIATAQQQGRRQAIGRGPNQTIPTLGCSSFGPLLKPGPMAHQPTLSVGLPCVPDLLNGQRASLSPRPTEGRPRTHQLHLGVIWTSAISHHHRSTVENRNSILLFPSPQSTGPKLPLRPFPWGRSWALAESGRVGSRRAPAAKGRPRKGSYDFTCKSSCSGFRIVTLEKRPLAHAEKYISPGGHLTALEESQKAWGIVTVWGYYMGIVSCQTLPKPRARCPSKAGWPLPKSPESPPASTCSTHPRHSSLDSLVRRTQGATIPYASKRFTHACPKHTTIYHDIEGVCFSVK